MPQPSSGTPPQIPVPQGAGNLEVKTSFFPLAFFLYACRPCIEINENHHSAGWGQSRYDLPAGEYQVTIYFPYLFLPQCGKNSLTVQVKAGETTRVSFFMPPLVFLKGSMKVG